MVFKVLLALFLWEKQSRNLDWSKIELLSTYIKITCYIFLRREIFLETTNYDFSNLIYHKKLCCMQTYHTSRFMQGCFYIKIQPILLYRSTLSNLIVNPPKMYQYDSINKTETQNIQKKLS